MTFIIEIAVKVEAGNCSNITAVAILEMLQTPSANKAAIAPV